MTDFRGNLQMFGGNNEERDFQRLRRLAVSAPTSTFSRFRKRANILQGTRMLFESQIHGFWIVLDIVLKRLFRPARHSQPYHQTHPDVGERA